VEPNRKQQQREREAALNQALRRDVNERALESAAGARVEFLCECGDAACKEVLPLTADEAEFVRRVPNRLVVKIGHTHPASERVLIEEPGRFQVLEKLGPGEDVVAHLFPRARELRAAAARRSGVRRRSRA
jgi:hypothetical protein